MKQMSIPKYRRETKILEVLFMSDIIQKKNRN